MTSFTNLIDTTENIISNFTMSSVPESTEFNLKESDIITFYYGLFWFVIFIILVTFVVSYHLYWTAGKRANKRKYGGLV